TEHRHSHSLRDADASAYRPHQALERLLECEPSACQSHRNRPAQPFPTHRTLVTPTTRLTCSSSDRRQFPTAELASRETSAPYRLTRGGTRRDESSPLLIDTAGRECPPDPRAFGHRSIRTRPSARATPAALPQTSRRRPLSVQSRGAGGLRRVDRQLE